MSAKDSSPGLLSKVVNFVRNPATLWSARQDLASVQEEAASKQLLKEMIERKRRNDFVRKREFDILRKMRKRDAKAGTSLSARTSYFQSSMPSKPDDRAKTLKKIDDIEAQMSMQWWKTNAQSLPDSVTPSAATSGQPPPASLGNDRSGESAQASDYAATVISEIDAVEAVDAVDFLAAQSALQANPFALDTAPDKQAIQTQALFIALPNSAAQAPPAAARSALGSRFNFGNSLGFTASKQQAIDVSEVDSDAGLEEAAIRFANGDDAGAEVGLLELLSPSGQRARHLDSWMMLFDFYRAIGQQENFEIAALEFVQRFERSAPQWFSIPAMVQQLVKSDARALGNGPSADWVCPSVVGLQSVATLRAAMDKFAMPWRLDWRKLKAIEAAAVKPLTKVFALWAEQRVQLHFFGNPQLQQILQSATSPNSREIDPDCWLLRLEALRVTQQLDEFEQTALDFCVIYEVSPPAWEKALCDYQSLDDEVPQTGATLINEVYRDSLPSFFQSVDHGDTQIGASGSQLSRLVSVELSGLIQGDAIAVLAELEARMLGTDVLLIACAKLIRVDFSAAGTLLNWVMARSAENRVVKFSEVNRLVAVFFNVIGISAHAQVQVRAD